MQYQSDHPKLSRYDSHALAVAKARNLYLLTTDGPLRKVARQEGVDVMETLGLLDLLLEERIIEQDMYVNIMQRIQRANGGKIRLPTSEIDARIKGTSDS